MTIVEGLQAFGVAALALGSLLLFQMVSSWPMASGSSKGKLKTRGDWAGRLVSWGPLAPELEMKSAQLSLIGKKGLCGP